MTLYKAMKKGTLALLAGTLLLTGCKKLDLQKDYDRDPVVIDPHVNMTAWDYLKARSSGNPDKIWEQMYQAIIYSEIDTNEYKKPGRTFIFLNNDAITRVSTANPPSTDVGFWGAFRVNSKNATKWSDYSKEFVRAYLQYLIIEGVNDHYTLPPVNPVEVSTLAPKGSLTALPTGITLIPGYPFVPNPESKMAIKVLNSSPSNTSDYPIVLNESRNVRTSSILATNGSIHAIDRFLTITKPE